MVDLFVNFPQIISNSSTVFDGSNSSKPKVFILIGISIPWNRGSSKTENRALPHFRNCKMAATEHRSNQVNSNTNQFQTILNRTIFSFFCNCPIVKQIFYSVLFHSFFPPLSFHINENSHRQERGSEGDNHWVKRTTNRVVWRLKNSQEYEFSTLPLRQHTERSRRMLDGQVYSTDMVNWWYPNQWQVYSTRM